MTDTPEDDPPAPQVNKISIKSPPFWNEDPELWFSHVEEQFRQNVITRDKTKYSHVLAQLDLKTSREVRDIIVNPPIEDRYIALKFALIQRLTTSQEQRIRQLLEHEELGDRKPSQFLRHLRTLAGTTTSEQLLRSLWLGRLPNQMQIILSIRSEDPLEAVAQQADRIHEATGRMVSELTAPKQVNEIQELKREIAELTKRFRDVTRFQPRDRSRSKSRERKKFGNLCFYHYRFREKARKCQKPCSFKSENQKGSQ